MPNRMIYDGRNFDCRKMIVEKNMIVEIFKSFWEGGSMISSFFGFFDPSDA